MRKRKRAGIPGPLVLVIGIFLLMITTGTAASPMVRHAVGGTVGAVVHSVRSVISSGPANERLADSMAASSYGWTGSEQSCLNDLWDRETGGTWDSLITDAITIGGHNAFGIAQALSHDPGGHSAVPGVTRHFLDGHSDTATVDEYPDRLANEGNAGAQIKWGLAYIRGRYGTPCGAWNGTNHDASGY